MTASVSVVPLVAVGTFDAANGPRYKTTIQITNAGPSTVTASAEFFGTDGTPLNVPTEARIDRISALTGSLDDFLLPQNSTMTITAGGSSTEAAVGWVRVTSSSHVTISSFFDLSDVTTGAPISRVWLPPSDNDLQRFALPRVRNVTTGADAGFVIVNTGSSAAEFTSTLFDGNRAVLATKTTTLAPRQQLSITAQQYFGLAGEPSEAYQSFIVVDSTLPQFAAVAVVFDGKGFVTLPVDRIPSESGGNTISRTPR
jgi:hypothetical protein